MATAGLKIDTRAWDKTFNEYVRLRKKDRHDLIVEKAAKYAYEVYNNIPATAATRIQIELSRDSLLLKLAVIQLTKKEGLSLKGRALTAAGRAKGRRKIKGGGSKKAITPGNILVRKAANRILSSRKRSGGYHRLAFLILSQRLRGVSITKFNPKSFLSRTLATVRDQGADRTIASLLAVARGLDCPTTGAATSRALKAVEADMIPYIERKLRETKAAAGFSH